MYRGATFKINWKRSLKASSTSMVVSILSVFILHVLKELVDGSVGSLGDDVGGVDEEVGVSDTILQVSSDISIAHMSRCIQSWLGEVNHQHPAIFILLWSSLAHKGTV